MCVAGMVGGLYRNWNFPRLCSVEFAYSGYGSLTEITEITGRYMNVVPVPVPPQPGSLKVYPYPGYYCTGVQNLHKFGYGHECRT